MIYGKIYLYAICLTTLIMFNNTLYIDVYVYLEVIDTKSNSKKSVQTDEGGLFLSHILTY